MLESYGLSMAALLLGGLGASVGATVLARSPRGQARLTRTSGWTLATFGVGAIALGALAAYWTVRPLLDSPGTAAAVGSPARLFLVGLMVGLPLSLPTLVLAWKDARAEARRRSKRRGAVVTKDDRRAYAADLVRQIQDVSDHPRDLQSSVGGDGGRVLVLEGDIKAGEIERLVTALRQDLKDLGFKRVECGSGPNPGWTKV